MVYIELLSHFYPTWPRSQQFQVQTIKNGKMAYVGLEHSLFYSSHSTLRMWSARIQVPGRTLEVAGL
jgi:hypothetical protein